MEKFEFQGIRFLESYEMAVAICIVAAIAMCKVKTKMDLILRRIVKECHNRL